MVVSCQKWVLETKLEECHAPYTPLQPHLSDSYGVLISNLMDVPSPGYGEISFP